MRNYRKCPFRFDTATTRRGALRPRAHQRVRWSLFTLLFGTMIFIYPLLGHGQLKFSLKNPCHTKRAVFEVGNANTKLTVAQVDACKHKLVRILHEYKIPVRYRDDLLVNDNQLSKKIQKKGTHALKLLKRKAREFDPPNFVAFISSTIKKAKNGGGFLNALEKATRIQFVVLDDEEKAKLGYQAARDKMNGQVEEIAVWDIGTSSMSFTTKDQEGIYTFFFSPMASVTFLYMVLDNLFTKNLRSPNPLGEKRSQLALKMIHKWSNQNIPFALVEHLKNRTLVGIGGVHYDNFKESVSEGETYTRKDLKKAIKKDAEKSDAEIGGPFASTQVTNLILVLGLMNHLNADKVRALRVNLTHGVLIDPDYW